MGTPGTPSYPSLSDELCKREMCLTQGNEMKESSAMARKKKEPAVGHGRDSGRFPDPVRVRCAWWRSRSPSGRFSGSSSYSVALPAQGSRLPTLVTRSQPHATIRYRLRFIRFYPLDLTSSSISNPFKGQSCNRCSAIEVKTGAGRVKRAVMRPWRHISAVSCRSGSSCDRRTWPDKAPGRPG